MGINIEHEADVTVVRVMGLLKKNELDAALNAEAKNWSATTPVKALIIVDGFSGWERGGDWGDLNFYAKHNHQIVKMAIVGDPKWKAEMLMFTATGLRQAPVLFFPTDQGAAARAWLAALDA